MKVLVIDDEADSRLLLRAVFGNAGHEVIEAEDGLSGLEAGRQTRPDVVISDILMPRVDGYQLCRSWKADPTLAGVPFIFYTASYTDPADERLAVSLGADAFLTKPQEPGRLLDEATRVVDAARAGLAPARMPESREESDVLREYSERLVRKLEEKTGALESANAELRSAIEMLAEDAEVKQALIETLHREAEQREAAQEALSRLDQMKSDFVSMVSHELRSPLTIILGYADLLARETGITDAIRAEMVAQLRRNGEIMRDIVDDLLTVSQMQAEGVTLAFDRCDLTSVVDSSLRRIELDESHPLALDVPPGLPTLRCDREQLASAVVHLLDNAVKYSPDGGEIRLTARAEGERVLLSVTDKGVGVAPEHIETMFAPFSQLDMTTRREFGGMGLGLFLAQQIAKAHGGGISVVSEPGVGSTFTLEFPAEPPAA